MDAAARQAARNEIQDAREVLMRPDANPIPLEDEETLMRALTVGYSAVAAIAAAETERDAARADVERLKEFVEWLHTETFVCSGRGDIRWSEWLRVQERARTALAATTTKEE